MKYTPGPWTADGTNIRGPDSHNLAIASGIHTVGSTEEALAERRAERARDHANARLIAASPQLYDALKEIIEAIRTANDTVDALIRLGNGPVRAAVAALNLVEGEDNA